MKKITPRCVYTFAQLISLRTLTAQKVARSKRQLEELRSIHCQLSAVNQCFDHNGVPFPYPQDNSFGGALVNGPWIRSRKSPKHTFDTNGLHQRAKHNATFACWRIRQRLHKASTSLHWPWLAKKNLALVAYLSFFQHRYMTPCLIMQDSSCPSWHHSPPTRHKHVSSPLTSCLLGTSRQQPSKTGPQMRRKSSWISFGNQAA